jgi:putative transposase
MFERSGDYAAFETLLSEAKARVSLHLFAYCVMPNHWHLVLCPQGDRDLSQFMHWLTMTHAQRWHAHKGSAGTGSVYQGRFKAIPVESNHHFLIACRYVERNPLRANLVRDAADWRWSSFWRRMHNPHGPLLDQWPVARPPAWNDWVNQPQTESEVAAIRNAIRRGAPLGSSAWTSEVARTLSLEPALRPSHRQTTRAPDPLLTNT